MLSKARQARRSKADRFFRRVFVALTVALVPLLGLAIATALMPNRPPDAGDSGRSLTAGPAKQESPIAATTIRATAIEGEPLIIKTALPAAPTLPDIFRAPEVTPGMFAPPVIPDRPLSRFRSALSDLRSEARHKPVVVLHIGDSHVASDSFSRGVRTGLQEMFGSAGRGAVVPAGAFKYATAADVKTDESGPWTSTTSMQSAAGPYGISGIRMVSSSSSAKLTLTTTDRPFDWVEVMVATGPNEGKVRIAVGDTSQVFDARSSRAGAKSFRLARRGTTAVISPAGGGRTTILWHAVGNERPGVRYVNFGLIGATAEVTKRWSDSIVKADIAAIDPDLVVIGYGTNDGFNDNLQARAFRQRITRLIDLVRSVSPDTEFLLIGPADGMRRASRGSICSTAGWSSPPKLQLVRKVYRDIAQEYRAGYWDWSLVMGGDCGINRWTAAGLAAGDRVHLTSKGYARSASALLDFLAAGPLPESRVSLNN